VPLEKDVFLAFERGERTVEYKHDRRWNERVCAVGRPAALSLGYAGRRLDAVVAKFERRKDGSAAIRFKNIRPSRAKPNASTQQATKPPTPNRTKSDKYELKTKPTGVDVKSFIAEVPDAARRKDAETVLALLTKVTGEAPTMWGPSIVGFGKYRYKYESGHEGEMCAAGFSPRKGATVVYLVPGFSEDQALLKKLGKHKTGVSCLYINKLADVDMKVLEQLVRKSWARIRDRLV
jgi:hypothetical protein